MLTYFFDQLHLNARQAWWMTLVIKFDFEILHIKVKENRVVDALNRTMQNIHLELVRTCELDVKYGIKISLQGDGHYNYVKRRLEQYPKGIRFTHHYMIEYNMLIYKGRLHIHDRN